MPELSKAEADTVLILARGIETHAAFTQLADLVQEYNESCDEIKANADKRIMLETRNFAYQVSAMAEKVGMRLAALEAAPEDTEDGDYGE